MKRFNPSLKCFKVSLQAGVAFEDGVHNKFSSVEHAIMSATFSPNSSSSIDNRNLNLFPYKLNLFTKLVYIQICQSQIITYKPTYSFPSTGRMPFMSPISAVLIRLELKKYFRNCFLRFPMRALHLVSYMPVAVENFFLVTGMLTRDLFAVLFSRYSSNIRVYDCRLLSVVMCG